jgi:hypothetical protein
LHTEAVAEVIQTVTEITETLEAWDKVTEIKMAEVQVAVADLTTVNNSAVAEAEAEQQTQA